MDAIGKMTDLSQSIEKHMETCVEKLDNMDTAIEEQLGRARKAKCQLEMSLSGPGETVVVKVEPHPKGGTLITLEEHALQKDDQKVDKTTTMGRSVWARHPEIDI